MNTAPERPENTVDPKLLEILVCPLTKGPLEFDSGKQELISRSAKLAYPIRDGIPIMLPEEARQDRMIRACARSSSRSDAWSWSSPTVRTPTRTKFASARSMRGCPCRRRRAAAGRAADCGLGLDRSRRQWKIRRSNLVHIEETVRGAGRERHCDTALRQARRRRLETGSARPRISVSRTMAMMPQRWCRSARQRQTFQDHRDRSQRRRPRRASHRAAIPSTTRAAGGERAQASDLLKAQLEKKLPPDADRSRRPSTPSWPARCRSIADWRSRSWDRHCFGVRGIRRHR